MRKITIFILLALLLTFGATPVYAQPALPHAFYGSVTINGSPAPNGTRVAATVDNGTIVSTQNPVTTAGDSYGITSPKLLVQGDGLSGAITFYVNGVEAEGATATFEAGGGPTEMNLSVTIAAPTPGPGAGPAPPRPPPAGTTDVRGEISAAGVFEDSVTAFSDDGFCTLTIPEGTVGLTEELEPLEEITILREADPPDPPEEADIVLAYDLGPDGATFYPPVTLTFSYAPADIPEGKDVLVVADYNEATGLWDFLEGVVDPATNTITVSISGFTTFAIIARAAPPPPAPAAFSVTNLSVKPLEVEPKVVVTISLSVANTGGMAGSYKVTLKINGVVEATQEVTVGAGDSETVTFTTSKDVAGSYSVDVNGLSGSFAVKEKLVPAPPPPAPPTAPPVKPINWPVVGGVIAAAVAVGLVIFFRIRRRRALLR